MTDQAGGLPEPQRGIERCTGCGNQLAEDQRYCLNCGKRRGKARIEYQGYLAEAGAGTGDGAPPAQGQVRPVGPEEPDLRPEREVTPLMAAAGLCAVAMILLVGVLIGRSGGGSESSGTPQFVASTGLPPTSTSSTSTTSTSTTITTDWPQGQNGFTIELATLDKEGADATSIEAAKTDLVGQGASEVGVLDSDQYGSLPTGNYVLYSGVYTTKAEAETALSGLKSSFPDAQVIEVSAEASGGDSGAGKGDGGKEATVQDDSLTDGSSGDQPVEATEEALEELDDLTGEAYEEAQKKLPPSIATPGEAPAKDGKAPGGGGDATTIG